MDPESDRQRLSRITTLWTLLRQAHAGPQDAAAAAQEVLMQRYCGAVYHYLLGAVRDEEAARELFQEFFLRFSRGDFKRAAPERGRFRDYVRTALIHLSADYHAERRQRPQPLPADYPAAAPADDTGDETRFVENWRAELISRTWAALAEGHAILFAVLLFRVRHPDQPSRQMAEQLSAELGKPFTAGGVRTTLSRAREKFAELLLDEVIYSLEKPDDEELLDELRALGLLQLCRPALGQRGLG